MQLTVLTLNTWGRNDPPGRRDLIRSGIDNARADIVSLQECDSEWHDLVPPGWHGVANLDLVVASRWPVRRVEVVDLRVGARHREETVAALVTRVALPEPWPALTVINPKPGWWLDAEDEREHQAVAIATLATRHDTGLPCVVAGDFDAAPDTASIRFLTGRQSLQGISTRLRDAWEAVHGSDPGHTWTTVNPHARRQAIELFGEPDHGRRIDYVFVGPHRRDADFGIVVRGCAITHDRPSTDPTGTQTWPSDHFGVAAQLDAERLIGDHPRPHHPSRSSSPHQE